MTGKNNPRTRDVASPPTGRRGANPAMAKISTAFARPPSRALGRF